MNSSRIRALAVGVLVLAGVTISAARADTVTATLPGLVFSAAPGDPPTFGSINLGTFRFSIPAGQAAVSATVAIAGLSVDFETTGTFYLNGDTVGTAGYTTSPENLSFDVDPSILAGGTADLTFSPTDYFAGCPCISTAGETLTIATAASTASVPEPATITLLGAALVGLGAARRRKS